MDENHVTKVLAVICQNRTLIVHEVAEEAEICKSLSHLILMDKMKTRHVAAKFVLHLLRYAQKENGVTVPGAV
jgi:hypothetical protein